MQNFMTRPRLASLRVAKILHKFTFKVPRILGICATDFSVDELQLTRVCSDYLIQLHYLLSKQKIIVATSKKEKIGKQELIQLDFSMLRKKFNSIKSSILLVKVSSILIELNLFSQIGTRRRTTSSSSLSDIKVAKIYSYTCEQITTLRH